MSEPEKIQAEHADQPSATRAHLPLCVDLDGTLLSSDMLLESAFWLLGQRPLSAFAMLGWLARGKAGFKHALAQAARVDVSRLPYSGALVDYVQQAREHGRHTVLVTATNDKVAREVADHLGCFDEVLASDSSRNLKGETKAEVLVERFGEGGYVYAGNSLADTPVWRRSGGAIVVGGSRRAARSARAVAGVEQIFDTGAPRVISTLHAMRPHQWLKNVLLFVPMLAAHRFEASFLFQVVAAFAAFSMVASAAYLLNDLLDLEADRSHPTKRHRPLAAGHLPLAVAMWLTPALVIGGFTIAAAMSGWFMVCLFTYFCLTVAYSFYLKRMVVVDVMTLAGLYTLRVVAGGAAIGIPISFWLLAFSMFLFLSLAFVKRTTEVQLASETRHDLSRRGYGARDTEPLRTMGIASGYMAVLVIALYINSSDVTRLYAEPQVLWLLCPCALYWVTRLWLKTSRGEMHDDPLVFTVKDRGSQILAVILALILLAANLPLAG